MDCTHLVFSRVHAIIGENSNIHPQVLSQLQCVSLIIYRFYVDNTTSLSVVNIQINKVHKTLLTSIKTYETLFGLKEMHYIQNISILEEIKHKNNNFISHLRNIIFPSKGTSIPFDIHPTHRGTSVEPAGRYKNWLTRDNRHRNVARSFSACHSVSQGDTCMCPEQSGPCVSSGHRYGMTAPF